MPSRSAVVVIVTAVALGGCARDRTTESSSGSTATTLAATSTSTAAPAGPSAPFSVSVEDGEITTSDGRVRTYRAHIPDTGDAEATLLVALHGGGGSASQYESASGWHELAATDGVLVVFPEGSGGGLTGAGIRTWNAGECCGPAVRDDVDDVGFVRDVIDEIARAHPVDTDAVLVVGHSNGAAMSYRLACELSESVAAIGVQAGPLGLDTCEPERPVSVLHLHGAEDPNVPLDGGVGEGVSGVDFSPVRDGLATLARVGGCADAPTTSVDDGGPRVTIESWAPCETGVEVELRVVEGAGHGWMAIDGPGGLGGAAPVGYDATAEIWAFLERWAS